MKKSEIPNSRCRSKFSWKSKTFIGFWNGSHAIPVQRVLEKLHSAFLTLNAEVKQCACNVTLHAEGERGKYNCDESALPMPKKERS